MTSSFIAGLSANQPRSTARLRIIRSTIIRWRTVARFSGFSRFGGISISSRSWYSSSWRRVMSMSRISGGKSGASARRMDW